MQGLEAFLDGLSDLDVELWLEGDELRCGAPRGVLTPGLRADLARRKPEIVAFLRRLSHSSSVDPIPAIPRRGDLPVSFGQERMWVLAQLDRERIAYNELALVKMVGPLDAGALERSLEEIVRRHEALRTRFEEKDGRPVQMIAAAAGVHLATVDLRGLPAAARVAERRRIARLEQRRPHDLSRGDLLRFILLRLEERNHVFLLLIHHLIADGWSVGLFVREMKVLYQAFQAGARSPLPELPIQYADFAHWQRQWLRGPVLDRQLDYWKARLAGAPPVLELPTDRPHSGVASYRGDTVRFRIDRDLTRRLKRLARQADATLFMTLLAGFAVLLARSSHQQELVIGSPIAGRGRRELESLIGLLINTLPLRLDLRGNPTFTELLGRMRRIVTEAFEHQDLPFERLVEELRPERDLSRNPLFQAMFVLLNVPLGEERAASLSFSPALDEYAVAALDLELSIQETEQQLKGSLKYRQDLFDAATIIRMAGQLEALLAGLAADPGARVADVAVLSAAERHQALVEDSDTARRLPAELLIHRRIARQAVRSSDAVAIVGGDRQLTYGGLDNRVTELAAGLRRAGVGRGALVGLCLERGPEMVAALLAVLEAGAAYVPLDPGLPGSRLGYMAADAGLAALVSERSLVARVPAVAALAAAVSGAVLWLDAGGGGAMPAGEGPAGEVSPDELAYVIYTSGSTGQPKGVQLSHRNVVNFLQAMAREPGLSAEDSVLAVTTLSFDIAVLELLLSLTVGAKTVIASAAVAADGERLARQLAQSRVSVMQATPATWQLLVQIGWAGEPRLKVLCGGEALPPRLAAELAGRGRELWNLYGPTETTVWSAASRIGPGEDVTLGRPVDNTALVVLDRRLRPVPRGVPGQLAIAGAGLARGYLRRPALTAASFCPDPFAGRGERLYLTGDLVRRDRAGRLSYLGRLDHQIKLRGFRIELGEIEAALEALPAVERAVVVLHEAGAGDHRLVAFLVSAGGGEPAASEIRCQLASRLPDYMVPAAFFTVAELPLNTSGKVDRKALARTASEPGAMAGALQATYVTPRTPTEERLAEIWRQVLGRDQIGIFDDFFALGGHSLTAIQVLSRVREALAVELGVRELFRRPTLAALAETVDERRAQLSPDRVAPPVVLSPAPRDRDLPLSFAQERLWFLDQLEPGSSAFNLQVAMRWHGRLRSRELEASLNQVRARHEVLRTTFPAVDGAPRQRIAPPAPRRLAIVDLSRLPAARRRAESERRQREAARRPFDLAAGPLLRPLLFRLDGGSADRQEHLLLMTLHHIVTDDWSNDVLRRELRALYRDRESGHRPTLPEPQVQYADYALWQRRLAGKLLERELAYWRGKLGDEPPKLDLPTDRPRPRVLSPRAGSARLVFAEPFTEALGALSRSAGASLFMTLVAAFKVVLARVTGQWDVCVGTPAAGRDRSEVEGLIGCFLNTLVLRTDLSGDPTFRQLLGRVRQVALEAYEHREIPFEKLLEELQPRRDLSHNPLFQVYCNLVHGSLEDFAAVPSGSAAERRETAGDSPGDKLIESTFSVARFDLNLYLVAGPERLDVVLTYRRDLFDPPTVRRMLGWYRTLLESIVEDPERPISALPLIGVDERRELRRRRGRIRPTNDFPAFPPSAVRQTLAARFAGSVDRGPGQVAVRTLEEEWSYLRLDRAANRAARAIQGALGRRGGERVALLLDSGVQAVQGMLGALKAGHVYLPLDPAYPPARLRFMLADAGAAAILTESKHVELARSLAGAAPMILEELGALAADPVVSTASPESLAYILYTSGSTGQPKGVMQSHRGVLGHARAYVNALHIAPRDRLTQLSSYTFDAAVMDIYGALLAGATLCPIPLRELAAGEVLDWLEDSGVTILHSTPSVFRYLTGGLAPGRRLRRVRLVVLGGEEARGTDVRSFRQHFERGSLLVNGLGPTESTLALQSFVDHDTPADRRRVPVGHGVDGTEVELIGAGGAGGEVFGEIALAGDHLALGYWRRPRRTARTFVPADGGGRCYRTGDLGRRRGDGAIEFMGRRDAQVKIRGIRVEPGEVAAMCESHPAVRSAAVVAVAEAGEHRLAAYVVPEAAAELRAAELRPFLAQRLPDHLVPGAIVSLDALPVTPTGKLDRSALPAPEWGEAPAAGYVSPRSEIERQIAALWCEVLGVERVGVRDNFFDHGGHSLRLLQVQAKLQQRLGRKVTAAELFQYPTVETLAARLVEGAAPERSPRRAAEARAGARRRADGDAVAVVAMAGRFPEAPDLETFWRNLRDGVESIRAFTDDELRAAGVPEAQLGDPSYVKAGTVLDGADLFDAWFFGYNPREAELIDPQQRLFLECAWQALERAGCDPARFDGLIGVWAGADLNRYRENLRSHPEILAEAGGFQVRHANDKNHLATRVSYKLDLKGPSVNVQTACSTSLVAVHEACAALREHRCDLALAGGVSVIVPFVRGYLHVPDSILSPDGHCRPFDARAAGTLGASGLGIVVLKRLADAQRDGDRVCALIRGTAVNNDGARKVGYTAPSVDGQAEVIALAHAAAGVDPETITYVEAHGTGTALGDPVEVAALHKVFGEATARRRFCGLGSLKSNIGHLGSTAGVGGLIKTVLALQHRELPPSLHFEQPNPEIDFDHSAFYVNQALQEWPGASGAPRRAGVSSFGIGGTNAHAVLEEAPPPAPAEAPSRPEQLLVLSAKTPAALARAAENLAGHLEESPRRGADGTNPDAPLADAAWTLQTGRAELEHRRAVVAASVADARAALRGERRQASSIGQAVPGRREVAFLFPGQGAQYAGMGHELYRRERVFRAAVDRCCDLLAGELDADLRAVLYPASGASEEASARLKRTSWAQPALFVTEIALAEQWRSWGIEPSAMAGHSIGEWVAATLSGVLRLEDALPLVALRGRLMERMPAGVMTAVPLPAAEIETRLAGRAGLWLSAVNGPSLCVVSGTEERVAAWQAELEAAGVECRRQHTSHAFHSALMEAAVAPFVDAVRAVTLGEPRIPYVSNVTGRWITAEDARDPGYWGRHIRRAVRFSDGLDRILAEDRRVLLEVGPGRVLGTLARQQPRWTRQRLAVASLRRPAEEAPDVEFLLGALGRLWAGGVRVDWRQVHGGERRRRVELPTYPFERQRFWIERRRGAAALAAGLGKDDDVGRWFYVPVWKPVCDPQPIDAAAGEAWLVLSGPEGLGAKLTAELARRGGDVAQAVPGEAFGKIEQGRAGGVERFVLDPESREDFRDLLRALAAADRLPSRIVHAWSLAPGSPGDGRDTIESSLVERGFYSLLALVQALAAEATGEIAITVLTRGGQRVVGGEALRPPVAMIQGLCRVIPQEHPGLACRTVDIEPRDETLVRRLADEVASPAREPAVAYRGAQRWVQGYGTLELPAAEPPVRPRGVYLITGGLGKIGRALARWLAERAPVRLVLTSRSDFPARDTWDARCRDPGDPICRGIECVRGIEALGAEVRVARADVADAGRMRRLVGEIEERWGGIAGVVHCAGIQGVSRGIVELDRETCEAQWRVKVDGLLSLHRALGDRRLDFRIAMSSLSAVLGGLGMAAYVAGNAFMDLFAWLTLDGQARDARGAGGDRHPAGGPWLSVDWDSWRFDPPSAGEAEGGVGRFAMTPAEGGAAFGRLLRARGVGQIVISTGNLERRLADWVERPAAEDPAAEAGPALHERPALGTAFAPPRSDVERHLATVWQSLLGVESVGIDDDFFDLGGHSLLATQLLNRLNARYPDARLAVRTLFEHPTVAGLAAIIEAAKVPPAGALLTDLPPEEPEDVQQVPEAGVAAALEGPLPDDVDGMSTAEVDELLAELAKEDPGAMLR